MALQEFLASYAVSVDEDGSRRLLSVLESNRKAAQSLADAFAAARSNLSDLLKDLSAPGAKNLFPGISGLPGMGGTVGFSLSGAEEALSDFKNRAESFRPRLSVNTSGITSAVASAISAARSMLSSLSITLPITAKTTLDNSGLSAGLSNIGASLARFGTGGRVSAPTFAMIAEEGSPEYVIPVRDEARAIPLLQSLYSELSSSARARLMMGASAHGASYRSVQAPVTISVASSAAAPEAVGRSVYDAAQRYLLRTLQTAL